MRELDGYKKPKDRLKQIIRIIGLDAAVKLERKLGGAYRQIPTQATADSQLAKAIGQEAAAKLIKEFGGSKIWIPKVLETQRRNGQIIEMHLDGHTTREIALTTGIADRTVRKVLHIWRQQCRTNK